MRTVKLFAIGLFLSVLLAWQLGCPPTPPGEAPNHETPGSTDGGVSPSDRGVKPPDRGTKPPDRGTQPPDRGTQPPDRGVKPPDRGTQPPDARRARPDVPPATGVHQYPPKDPKQLALGAPGKPAPRLQPRLLVLTYAGGKGAQYIRSISFDAQGAITAEGKGFSLRFDASGRGGKLEGDPSTDDKAKYDERPPLSGKDGRAYNHSHTGLTIRVGYRQAGNLQMPIFRAFQGATRLWSLWGHSVSDAQRLKITADSRCYQAWGMPQGRIGVQCWTDGGNSVLAKGPRDLTTKGFNPAWARGSYQPSAGGMSSMYALVDASQGGSVVSGTFVASHVAALAVDAWGRVYLAHTGNSRSRQDAKPTNPFQQSERAASGILALNPSLTQPLFHARLGGSCDSKQGKQAFGVAALRGNLLVLGGTTCAPDLKTQNAPQKSHGGGQDAMLAIIQLWP